MNLEVTDDALRAVAHLAMKHKTGARGLRAIMVSVCFSVFSDTTVLNILAAFKISSNSSFDERILRTIHIDMYCQSCHYLFIYFISRIWDATVQTAK